MLDGTLFKTIMISVKTKARLDELKIHPREPYYEVLDRILFETDSPIKK